jgi:ubiquitin C-terminal hydrolase
VLVNLAVAPSSGTSKVEAAADVDNVDAAQSDRVLAAHHWAQYLVGMCRAALGSGALPQLSVALSQARLVAEGGSVITRHFAFQLRRATICKECGETARKFDVAYTLDVPIPNSAKGGAVALSECLRSYLGVEHTPQRDAFYTCRRCGNAKRASVQQLALYSTPPVLVVTLKRFDAYGSKVETPVVFPQELDLAPYMAAASNGAPVPAGATGAEYAVAGDPLGSASTRLYRLCGHVSHQGTLSQGHYTASTCDVASGSNQWTYYSDERVKPVAGTTADFAFAYSLYYVRV